MAKTLETETQLQYVSPDLLDFDPENPRFAGLLKSKKPDAIQKELYGEPYYASELVDSLVENGFIDYEPLVVKRKGDRFTVVEGNRRLAAIKEIRDNPTRYEGRKDDLKEIPVLVFPERPGKQLENEMRVYLGVRHLLGFREWPPISKAQFLERESSKAGGLDRVIKETRISKTQARRFLVPLRLLNHASEKIPKDDFWVLGEALGRAGIKNFIRLETEPSSLAIKSYDKKRLVLLLSYLYGPKTKKGERNASAKVVTDTRALSRLANVLGSEEATAVLNARKSLDEAEIYVDTREQSLKRLTKLSNAMHVLIKKILYGERGNDALRLLKAYKELDDQVKSYVGRASVI